MYESDGVDIDQESPEFFRPGIDRATVSKTGTHTFDKVVPSMSCHVCNSTMCKIGRKESFFYCIKPDCIESQVNAEHSRTYSGRMVRRFFLAAVIIMIGGAMFNSSMPIIYRGDAGIKDIIQFVCSILAFGVGLHVIHSAKEDVIIADLCDREESYEIEQTLKALDNQKITKVRKERKDIGDKFPTAIRLKDSQWYKAS